MKGIKGNAAVEVVIGGLTRWQKVVANVRAFFSRIAERADNWKARHGWE